MFDDYQPDRFQTCWILLHLKEITVSNTAGKTHFPKRNDNQLRGMLTACLATERLGRKSTKSKSEVDPRLEDERSGKMRNRGL